MNELIVTDFLKAEQKKAAKNSKYSEFLNYILESNYNLKVGKNNVFHFDEQLDILFEYEVRDSIHIICVKCDTFKFADFFVEYWDSTEKEVETKIKKTLRSFSKDFKNHFKK